MSSQFHEGIKMRGYSTLKQFSADFHLFQIAKKIDPGREGETITSYMKKRIDDRLAKVTKSFNDRLLKQKYSVDDLKFIAIHDSLGTLYHVEFFVRECFGTNYAGPEHYRKLLKSAAFKSGRLKRIYEFIPARIETQNDFIRFIKMRKGISKSELNVIMNAICKKDWHVWLDELIDNNKIIQDRGRWLM